MFSFVEQSMKFIVEEMHRSIDEHSLSPSECLPATLPCLGFTLSFQQLILTSLSI